MAIVFTLLGAIGAIGAIAIVYWLYLRYSNRNRLVIDEELVGKCEKCGAEVAARVRPLAMWDVKRLSDGRPVMLMDRPHPCFDPVECLRLGMEATLKDIIAFPPELQKLIDRTNAMETTCRCKSERCGHPNGEPCGKPVERPLPTQVELDADGPIFSPEFLSGVCEECLKVNGVPSK